MQARRIHPGTVAGLQDRCQAFHQLVASLGVFTGSTYGSPVRRVAQYLIEHAYLRIPSRDAAICYVSDDIPTLPPEEMVFIALVATSDQWLLADNDPAMEYTQPARFFTSYGAYYKSTRSIYLSADLRLSVQSKALVLLHEAAHVYDHLVRGSPGTYQEEESYARSIEVLALHGSLGPALDEVLAAPRLLDDVLFEMSAGRPLNLYEPPAERFSEREMDDLFGTAVSPEESHYRRLLLGKCLINRAREVQREQHGRSYSGKQ